MIVWGYRGKHGEHNVPFWSAAFNKGRMLNIWKEGVQSSLQVTIKDKNKVM